MSDPIIRANRWKLAFEEEGGLSDMLDKMRKAYFTRAGKLDPTLPLVERLAVLEQLSLASHIVDQVENHIRAIVDDGKIEAHNIAFSNKIADLPERKQRFAQFK